jgi:hypothetical protein
MIECVLEQPIANDIKRIGNNKNPVKTRPIQINSDSQQQMSRVERSDIRYQYDLKPDIFDPFSSSPPETFMLKLKERIHTYSNQCGFSLHTKDLIRNSE